jgi:peptide/nickel transport system ATP-binding protein
VSLLTVEHLTVRFGGPAVVRDSTFAVEPGEVLAVVGESGSGKTVSALALLGLLPAAAEVSGRARLHGDSGGTELIGLDRAAQRAIRGNRIAMVFQEPISALNPVLSVGSQVVEAIRAHRKVSRRAARQRTRELFELVGLPQARLRSFPHEFSGGQLQRIVIAMAVANDPELLIADEPTTALDVTVQAEVLELLRDLQRRLGMAMLLITHDMGVVADLADRVLVMRGGEILEEAPVERLFAAPAHPYTKALLEAAGQDLQPFDTGRASQGTPPLRMTEVSKRYRGSAAPAVDRVSLHVEHGETLGIVGESGSGKTTLAGMITGLLPPTSGTVEVLGTDLGGLSTRERRRLGRRLGMVFQDPASSLNPRNTVADSIAEPIRLHRVLAGAAVDARVDELLESVELASALRTRYPHELSGGQRQRVALARAIALGPDLLVADEPTSALDVSIQAKILVLFERLQQQLRFGAVFISHDLAVIERVAHRVAVMYRGELVEVGPTAEVLSNPQNAYTARLLAAAPVADPRAQRDRRARWRRLEEALVHEGPA